MTVTNGRARYEAERTRTKHNDTPPEPGEKSVRSGRALHANKGVRDPYAFGFDGTDV